MRLLREDNLQRDKTFDEKLREEMVEVSTERVRQRVAEYRHQSSQVALERIEIEGVKRRWGFAPQSMPFVEKLIEIVNGQRDYWPLSIRRVHYVLLDDRPLTYIGRPQSRYSNDEKFYGKLSDFLTRMRISGLIPMDAIDDETRPVQTWAVHSDVRPYLRGFRERLFLDYWRDRMQSQPCHYEAVVEKLTITPIVSPILGEYTIPMTTGRGYDSIPPRYQMAQRFHRSGKDRLVVLMLGDFDPEGEDIGHAFARSMRDDFEIDDVHAIKVALKREHVERFNLPPMMKAKKTSSRRNAFVAKHGDDVWELDAIAPEQLQQILRDAIDSVIDVELYNREVDAELTDQRDLAARRNIVFKALGMVDPSDKESNE